MATRWASEVHEGMDVFDVDGDKVGSVQEVAGDEGARYMKVSTGLFGLGGDRYIPYSAVQSVRDNNIYLNADKDDAERLGWDAPPRSTSQASAATAATMPAARWEDEARSFRADWEQRQPTSGGRWEEHEPAYRTGWEAANNPRYRQQNWDAVEPELRRDWERQNRKPPWDQATEDVRRAWHRTIELRGEQLRPVKETREAGAVTLNKEVVTEQKTVDVPVTHEEVVIERRPVAGQPTSGEIKPDDKKVRVPVEAEQVRLEKDTVVTEELDMEKRPVTETEHLTGTVRREELRVNKEGNVKVRDTRPEPPSTQR
ncbi:MAG TPA: YsnF/AvaK domain-containing protein [Chloroflexota bacterium]|nr:YsnF/AvaK domain-containing protein [Chloroflexota bacterium]